MVQVQVKILISTLESVFKTLLTFRKMMNKAAGKHGSSTVVVWSVCFLSPTLYIQLNSMIFWTPSPKEENKRTKNEKMNCHYNEKYSLKKSSSRRVFTACSKSADMPIDSSHCSSGIPSALQTSALQFDNLWWQQTGSRELKKHKQNRLITQPCTLVGTVTLKFSGVDV